VESRRAHGIGQSTMPIPAYHGLADGAADRIMRANLMDEPAKPYVVRSAPKGLSGPACYKNTSAGGLNRSRGTSRLPLPYM